jgi:hypothetical protein
MPAIGTYNSPSAFDPHWALYPKTYVAPYCTEPIQIDGNISKPQWSNVPWSDVFGDIQGDNKSMYAPATTKFKAQYDESFLYIAALLEPSSDFNTQAHFTQRNDPIYQRDSDFEVFIDAAGTTHNYKELEVNALNTVWNLLLDKPYSDGGVEHSGRVARPKESLYWDSSKQTTAARVVRGQLNDNEGVTWTVELALSIDDLLDRLGEQERPRVGTRWRINFSRVELQGSVNWTWQPQIVWDAALQKHAGKINMHLPDAWGYLVFGKDSKERDATWPAKLAAMNVYYAMHYHKQQTGSFTNLITKLNVDKQITDPFDIAILLQNDAQQFVITIIALDDGTIVSVRDDRLLQVQSSLI